MTRVCKCCGQPIIKAPPDLVEALHNPEFPGRMAKILDEMVRAWPRPVSADTIIENVFDPFGRAKDELNIVRSLISRMRPRLEKHGWKIEMLRGRGYRIERASK